MVSKPRKSTKLAAEQRDLSRQSYAQLRRFILNAAIPAVSKRYGFTTIPPRWPRPDRDADNELDADGYPYEVLREPGIEVAVDDSLRALLEWKYVDAAAPGDTSALMAGLLQVRLQPLTLCSILFFLNQSNDVKRSKQSFEAPWCATCAALPRSLARLSVPRASADC